MQKKTTSWATGTEGELSPWIYVVYFHLCVAGKIEDWPSQGFSSLQLSSFGAHVPIFLLVADRCETWSDLLQLLPIHFNTQHMLGNGWFEPPLSKTWCFTHRTAASFYLLFFLHSVKIPSFPSCEKSRLYLHIQYILMLPHGFSFPCLISLVFICICL